MKVCTCRNSKGVIRDFLSSQVYRIGLQGTDKESYLLGPAECQRVGERTLDGSHGRKQSPLYSLTRGPWVASGCTLCTRVLARGTDRIGFTKSILERKCCPMLMGEMPSA